MCYIDKEVDILGERTKNALAHFWLSSETDETVRRIAKTEGRSVSMVYRDLVEKGLVAGGYRSGSEDLSAMVQTAVQEAMRPQIERLAAISAKGTQVSAAAFFLAVYNGRQALPDYLRESFEEVAAQARKLGIEYLKLSKDKNLDDFIRRGVRRMGDDEL